MSSGGGAQGETRYDWNDDMGPRWNTLLNTAFWNTMEGDGMGGFKPQERELYTGTRFAPITQEHQGARTNAWAMNDLSSSPLGAMNAARSQIEGTLGGNYLTGLGKNPNMSLNPNTGLNSSTDRNLFAGDSPYFRQALFNGMDDITGAYQRGTSADTTRMFNLAGAFGGSAHQNAIANNEAALGKTLSNYASGMINDQYNRSAGLEDAFLGRDLQAQQFNQGMTNQNYESALNRGFQGFENERNRMMGAVGQGQAEQGLAYQRNNELMNMGNFMQGQDQRNLDFLFEQDMANKNYPFTMMQFLSGLYGQAMGGGAGINQSVYGSSGSSAAPWLGAALAGASLFG